MRFKDPTILNENTYLQSLKETREVNPAAKLVMEKKLAALKEEEGKRKEKEDPTDE